MEVICLEEKAFYALIDHVVQTVKEREKITEEKWIPDELAMKKLGITSKTTLQKYRDEGKIRFTMSGPRIFLYDLDSIYQHLEKNAKNTF